MILRCFYLFVFLLSSGIYVNAQNKFIEENHLPANAIDAEKIYLQLTGNTYNTSETIWFKAIVTNALDNQLSSRSAVLYVELIDPVENKIVDYKILKLIKGIADGSFQLHQNYPEGKYAIRAYTEWNKNFGKDFFFSTYVEVFRFQNEESKPSPIQNIVITDNEESLKHNLSSSIYPMKLDSLHKGQSKLYLYWEGGLDSIPIKHKKNYPFILNYEVPKNVKKVGFKLQTLNKTYSKTVVLDKDFGTLTFFPEGGSLVNGLKSNLGFKYLDYNGKGNQVSGIIVDQNNDSITSFTSNSLGMGKVEFIPEKDKIYSAVLWNKIKSGNKFEIPSAKSNGIVLNVINEESSKVLSLKSQPKKSDSVFVKFHHRGTDLYLIKAQLKEGNLDYKFQNLILPNGIIRVTVYDEKLLPVCERHFFNYNPKDWLEIELKTNKQSYLARDSVLVNIVSKKNGKPVSASMSLMAINKDYFEKTNLDKSDICSYLMLESDIRGKIENPSYYFENPSRLKDLDYLMITQGWTNYKYDTPRKPKIIQPEKGLVLSGYVGGMQNITKKKKDKEDEFAVNMLTFGEKTEFYKQQIDKSGYFEFTLKDSYGTGKKFVIQPASTTIKTKNFKVRVKQREIPKIDYEISETIVPVDTIIKKTVSSKIAESIKFDPFLLPNTIALDEVEVSDYLITPERKGMVDLHGLPDVVIDNKELLRKEKNWTSRLYSWLLFNYPNELDVVRVGPASGFLYAKVHGAGFTYVVIDGEPVNLDFYDLIPDIPIEAVKSTEIIRNAASANRYFFEVFHCAPICPLPKFPAILAIYTYSGKGLFGAFPKKNNTLSASAPEFSPRREFYSPDYSNREEIDNTELDLRTLLHWEPNIITNENGMATVKFYNGDISDKMLVFCEGITVDGKVGFSSVDYTIVE